MLDLAYVRANLPLVKEKLRSRGLDAEAVLGKFRMLDVDRRQQLQLVEGHKAQINQLSAEVAMLKRSGRDADAQSVMNQVREIKAQLEILPKIADAFELEFRRLLEAIPNLPHDSVPVGKSEKDNQIVRSWGKPTKFDFEPKDHIALGESLGILDFERAAKISGARFVVHFGAGARLERALAAFMLDLHTREHGYTEVLPPYMVNSASLFGTGQLPKFEEDLFFCVNKKEFDVDRNYDDGSNGVAVEELHRIQSYIEGSNHWLIPTAEVPVTNLFRDETIDLSDGPISFTAFTPCFRSEAGSYGRDTRGMVRQHQFQKVELVKFCAPEDSYDQHEKLTRHAEIVLEKLGLPYRRMLLCTGDMGFSSAKTYDLEVWLPGQNTYREISSCSNFEAFQARRANIRYKPAGAKKAEFVHTLNGSGLAVGRTYLAILENYQQADGTVRVPDVLVPYMGGETVIVPQPLGKPAKLEVAQ